MEVENVTREPAQRDVQPDAFFSLLHVHPKRTRPGWITTGLRGEIDEQVPNATRADVRQRADRPLPETLDEVVGRKRAPS